MINNPIVIIERTDYMGSSYTSIFNTIALHLPKIIYDNMTDEQIEKMVMNDYNHEYMHCLLRQYVNQIVGSMYDVIADTLEDYDITILQVQLFNKYLNLKCVTWKTTLKEEGIDGVIRSKGWISKESYKNAMKKAGQRMIDQ